MELFGINYYWSQIISAAAFSDDCRRCHNDCPVKMMKLEMVTLNTACLFQLASWPNKCLNSYCLLLRFVCDGFWDCPYGFDEINCTITNHTGLFRCYSTSITILPTSVCDNIHDCPLEDDEEACDLSHVPCPLECSCLLHAKISYEILVKKYFY